MDTSNTPTKLVHDSETPAEGKQVFTACAFLYKTVDGEPAVFLAKRALTKKFLPGVFELPGGHIEWGEDLRIGLQREIREEFGITVDVGAVVDAFTYTNNIKKSHSIEVVFFARMREESERITIHPEDHSEYVWASAEEAYMYMLRNGNGEDDPELLSLQRGFYLLHTENSA